MNGVNTLLAIFHAALRRAGCPAEEAGVYAAAYDVELRERHGGQTLRLYVSKTQRMERVVRDQRIEAALKQGEAPEVITERENVSKRHMRRIRARFA